jgi:Ca-activated chloride channel homolog
MTFHFPIILLLLTVFPMLGKLLARAQKKQIEAAARLRGEKPFSNHHWKKAIALQLSAFATLILALAQPAWNPHPGPAGMRGRDLVIALDISRSMLAADVFPSRLDAAKIAIFESLDHLRGQRIGLITFAGAASVRVPLTLDHNFVRYLLDLAAPSDADVGSTSIQSAIEKAIDVSLKESEKGRQDLILFTDGEDYLSNIEKTAEELRECGARVLIVGLGDPVAGARIPDAAKTNAWMQYKGADVITRLDEAKLTQLAAESPNVTYYPAGSHPFELTSIYRKMLTDTAGLPASETGQTVYTEGYPWLIALTLLLWLAPARINRRSPGPADETKKQRGISSSNSSSASSPSLWKP